MLFGFSFRLFTFSFSFSFSFLVCIVTRSAGNYGGLARTYMAQSPGNLLSQTQVCRLIAISCRINYHPTPLSSWIAIAHASELHRRGRPQRSFQCRCNCRRRLGSQRCTERRRSRRTRRRRRERPALGRSPPATVVLQPRAASHGDAGLNTRDVADFKVSPRTPVFPSHSHIVDPLSTTLQMSMVLTPPPPLLPCLSLLSALPVHTCTLSHRQHGLPLDPMTPTTHHYPMPGTDSVAMPAPGPETSPLSSLFGSMDRDSLSASTFPPSGLDPGAALSGLFPDDVGQFLRPELDLLDLDSGDLGLGPDTSMRDGFMSLSSFGGMGGFDDVMSRPAPPPGSYRGGSAV